MDILAFSVDVSTCRVVVRVDVEMVVMVVGNSEMTRNV